MDRFKLGQIFQALTKLSDEEALRRRPLLELAAGTVDRRVKPSVDREEEEDVLLLLAASMAQYLDLLTETAGTSTVKVADVSVTTQSGSHSADVKRFYEEVLALAAPLLTDDDFAFLLTEA